MKDTDSVSITDVDGLTIDHPVFRQAIVLMWRRISEGREGKGIDGMDLTITWKVTPRNPKNVC